MRLEAERYENGGGYVRAGIFVLHRGFAVYTDGLPAGWTLALGIGRLELSIDWKKRHP